MKLLYKYMTIILLCLFEVKKFVQGVEQRIDPLVSIEQGVVRGIQSEDGSYSSFLGIPYAKVNLTNPFGPAEKHPGFGGEIFDANDGSITCPQPDVSTPPLRAGNVEAQAIDCLRLNVYVPSSADTQTKLPVLAYIHSGSFSVGSANQAHTLYLIRHEVIVVAFNYRLGPYGFFCLDTHLVSGNQGLKDQYDALRWINENIAAFGGDPSKITLAGHGAGSASVIYHLYSNEDKLFHQVIAASGAPQNYGYFQNGDLDDALKMAHHLGFVTNDTGEALMFLAQSPHNLVIQAFTETGIKLTPCIEKSFSGIKSFIETDPFSLSNQEKLSNTPVMIGFTDNEVYCTWKEVYPDEYFSNPFYYRLSASYELNDNLLDVVNTFKHFYIKDAPITPEIYSDVERFEADFVFNHPIKRTIDALLHENASPIYQYLFKYSGFVPNCHSTDQFYLLVNDDDEITEGDKHMIEVWSQLWANFIKYGNPTPATTNLLPVVWEPITKDNRPYLVVDTKMTLDHRVYNKRMAFWDLFILSYGDTHKLVMKCKKKNFR